ncbi:hypothetical protein [Viridibacterium curvum]|uniref:Uncharacterized protein n=1 Tax=Viridibacterium curvum TaxID=1101404 RepID=A0ABP9R8S5_9RHOO
MNTVEMASLITSKLPEVKTGALRFWGEWFGRPYDNIHQIVSCSALDGSLIIKFNEAETLTITNPIGLKVEEEKFFVQSADCVRWEWFCYGRLHTPENRYFEEFKRTESGIVASTNIDWCEMSLSPSASEKAVEIL